MHRVVLNINDNRCKMPIIANPPVERFRLPEASAAAEMGVDGPRGATFPAAGDGCQVEAPVCVRADQDMDVVGHDHPGPQSVVLPRASEQVFFNQFGADRVAQKAGTMTGVFITVDPSTKLGGSLHFVLIR